MFYYRIKFRLANDEFAQNVSLKDFEKIFSAAMNEFNEAGEKARTYKKILAQKIYSTYIEIYFECEKAVGNPTMCYRGYSKYIIDNCEELRKGITTSGNFLKGIDAVAVSASELPVKSNHIEEKIISDKEFIKSIIDLVMYEKIENAEEKKSRIRVINKMKNIVMEYNN